MGRLRWFWSALTSMSGRDRADVIRATIGLPAIALWLRFSRLTAIEARLRRSFREEPDHSRVSNVETVVSAVIRRHPYRANCLERSLTLWWMLGRTGVESDLRFGVRPAGSGGSPEFHAWVEIDGRVVNDRPDIASEFLAFEPPSGAPPHNLV